MSTPERDRFTYKPEAETPTPPRILNENSTAKARVSYSDAPGDIRLPNGGPFSKTGRENTTVRLVPTASPQNTRDEVVNLIADRTTNVGVGRPDKEARGDFRTALHNQLNPANQRFSGETLARANRALAADPRTKALADRSISMHPTTYGMADNAERDAAALAAVVDGALEEMRLSPEKKQELERARAESRAEGNMARLRSFETLNAFGGDQQVAAERNEVLERYMHIQTQGMMLSSDSRVSAASQQMKIQDVRMEVRSEEVARETGHVGPESTPGERAAAEQGLEERGEGESLFGKAIGGLIAIPKAAAELTLKTGVAAAAVGLGLGIGLAGGGPTSSSTPF